MSDIPQHPADLTAPYRAYIACLNGQAWPDLGRFVSEAVGYNGRPMGLEAYKAMLVANFEAIPDLEFRVGLLMADGDRVGARLLFDCTPRGEFLGLAVNGRRVSFTENVFYAYEEGRIAHVWSVLDVAAIKEQLEAA